MVSFRHEYEQEESGGLQILDSKIKNVIKKPACIMREGSKRPVLLMFNF